MVLAETSVNVLSVFETVESTGWKRTQAEKGKKRKGKNIFNYERTVL